MKYRLLTLTILFAVLPLIATAQTTRYARVISENANLRDMPNVSSTSILEVPEETLVKILDEKLPWYVVRIGNRQRHSPRSSSSASLDAVVAHHRCQELGKVRLVLARRNSGLY